MDENPQPQSPDGGFRQRGEQRTRAGQAHGPQQVVPGAVPIKAQSEQHDGGSEQHPGVGRHAPARGQAVRGNQGNRGQGGSDGGALYSCMPLYLATFSNSESISVADWCRLSGCLASILRTTPSNRSGRAI